jgi:uncharacterized protein (TIGR00297 family)
MAVALTALILLTRQGTAAGALAGLVVALCAVAGFGGLALLPLSIFVLGSGLLTRAGRARKEALGAAEGDRGRRGLPHVAAKLSLPALAGALAVFHAAPQESLAIVYVASLAGAFADTAATEAGPLLGGPVFGLRGVRPVRLAHGAPGGMSLAGFLAAALAAFAVGAGAHAVSVLESASAAWVAAGAGFVASTLESLLAGTALGARAGHFGRNVFLSVASAGLALCWAGS